MRSRRMLGLRHKTDNGHMALKCATHLLPATQWTLGAPQTDRKNSPSGVVSSAHILSFSTRPPQNATSILNPTAKYLGGVKAEQGC
ncbi:hypothetical protein IH879_21810 [candidate division KSB1 bacterium]|nr:hypothetical protein [candidate division KSB1 bacterium]